MYVLAQVTSVLIRKNKAREAFREWRTRNATYNKARLKKWVENNRKRVRQGDRNRYWKDPEKSRAALRLRRDSNLSSARLRDRERNKNPKRQKAKRRYAIAWKKNNRAKWRICHRLYQGR